MEDSKIENIFICEWEIENFLMWDTQALYTEFSAQNLCMSEWRIHLVDSVDFNAACILERRYDTREIKEIVVDCRIEVIGGNGEIVKCFTLTEESFNVGSKVKNMIMNTSCLISVLRLAAKDTLTIVCTFKNCKCLKGHMSSFSKCKAKTKLSFDQHNLLVSVPLPIPIDPIASIRIDSLLIGAYIATPIKFSVIRLRPVSSFGCPIMCKIGLLDAHGTLRKFVKESRSFLEDSEVWEFPSFFSVPELHNNDIYLRKNKFTLSFEFRYASRAANAESIAYVYLPQTHNSIDCLRLDFLSMLKNPMHTDVELTTDGKIYPAHKSVLAARSTVFRDKFEKDTPENRVESVDCTELDSSTMAGLLEFMYASVLEQTDWESSLKLMAAASKYGVPSLVEDCANYLKTALSNDNVYSVIEVSNRIGHDNLKKAALSYAALNSATVLPK